MTHDCHKNVGKKGEKWLQICHAVWKKIIDSCRFGPVELARPRLNKIMACWTQKTDAVFWWWFIDFDCSCWVFLKLFLENCLQKKENKEALSLLKSMKQILFLTLISLVSVLVLCWRNHWDEERMQSSRSTVVDCGQDCFTSVLEISLQIWPFFLHSDCVVDDMHDCVPYMMQMSLHCLTC